MGHSPEADSLDRAERAFASGDVATAKRLAEERLRRDPEDADALALLDDITLTTESVESEDAPASEAAGYTADNLSPTRPATPPAAAGPQRPSWGDLGADTGERPPARAARAAPRHAPPLGIAVVSALYALGAFAGGFVALMGVVAVVGGRAAGLATLLVGGILAVLAGAIALGLWRLRPWAWGIAVILAVVSFIGNLARPGDRLALAAAVANVILVTYLLVVRKRFRAPGDASGDDARGIAPP